MVERTARRTMGSGSSPLALASAIEAGKTPAVKWLEYDWTLNDLANAK